MTDSREGNLPDAKCQGEDGELSEALEELPRDTDRHQLELQLLQAGKMAALGELAASVAHELNNPLASISAFAEQLLEAAQNPALTALPEFRKFPGHLTVIRKNVKRCAEIIRGLLDCARPVEEAAQLLDVPRLLQDAVALVEHDASHKDVSVVREVPGGLPRLHGKKSELLQICLNLLSNAVDASPPGGVITVRARSDDGGIVFEFEDQGPGVPAGIADQIFSPFFTSKPKGKGTGLGLAISARIARQMQGRLDFENRGGGGAIFRVSFAAAGRNRIR